MAMRTLNEKSCAKCEKTRPFAEFSKCTRRWDGLQAYCKNCSRRAARERRDAYKRPVVSVAERFWPKVEKTDSCWPWRGSVDRKGYGRLRVDGRTALAHRIGYELCVGPIPEGLTLDHLCRNRGCVNPAHLEPVTHRENCLRAVSGPIIENAAKTHCKHGHAFTLENTYVGPNGSRICRTCQDRRRREYQERGAVA